MLVDVGSPFLSGEVHRTLRAWSAEPLHTAVYSHGHIDHVFGVHRFQADAEANGWPAPRVVAHEAVAARFDRYIATAGYNAVVNRRQFGIDDLEWPTRYRYPDVTFRDGLDLDVGGVTARLHHARGETDDHAWTWFPTPRVLCTGDLFIWASPNAGNPQKVQRFPLEWAEALRRMLTLFDTPGGGPEVLLPGHGYPDHGRGPHPAGAHRDGRAARVARGPDPRAHERRGTPRRGRPQRGRPRPPPGPPVPATGVRRARVRRPRRLAPLRGLVGREPGHPEAGARDGPRPGAGRAVRRGGGAGRTGAGPGWTPPTGRPTPMRTCGSPAIWPSWPGWPPRTTPPWRRPARPSSPAGRRRPRRPWRRASFAGRPGSRGPHGTARPPTRVATADSQGLRPGVSRPPRTPPLNFSIRRGPH